MASHHVLPLGAEIIDNEPPARIAIDALHPFHDNSAKARAASPTYSNVLSTGGGVNGPVPPLPAADTSPPPPEAPPPVELVDVVVVVLIVGCAVCVGVVTAVAGAGTGPSG